jgi:hypothetical protein
MTFVFMPCRSATADTDAPGACGCIMALFPRSGFFFEKKEIEKMRHLSLVVVLAVMVQVVAPSLCVAQEGSVEYGGIILRDGGMVMKDFHDSFDGDGWISGVVENSSAPAGKKTGEALLLVVRVAKSVMNGLKEDKLYNVMLDNKSNVFIATARSGSAHGQSGEGPAVADGITVVSKFSKGQRVSVAFRKGTQIAERLVNEGYEIGSRLNSISSGTASGPAMPKFD